MKKIYLIGLLALAGGTMVSCNDLLDKEPLDTIVDNPGYWNNSTNVTNQCNKLYNNFLGYGQGNTQGQFYFNALNDDQASAGFADWTYTAIPSQTSNWNSPFQQIRACNYIIKSVRASELEASEKQMFEGIARFNRAYQYYQLVRAYGDVQWIDGVIEPDDDALVNAPRDKRDVVMDHVLEDLDYAAKNIGKGAKNAWSSDAAQALKAEVCLFEGTFCKYRTQAENGYAPDQARAKKYLEEAVKAADAVIAAGYTLTPEYGTVYNQTDLSGCPEVIFFKAYSQPQASFGHGTIAFTNSTSSIHGINKQAFDSFLFIDGKPLATTTENKSDAVTLDANGKPTIEPLLAVRDKRLSVLIDPSIGLFEYEYERYPGSPLMTASTGYTIRKFYTPELTNYQLMTIGQNNTCAPLFWLAPVYLAYAEAKAELGTCSQADLDKTVNKLMKRAGLPGMTTSPAADPANNMGVSNLIWEIRRCRRCELMVDFFRYWDLIRWHQLDKLDTNKYPENFLGANVVNLDQSVIAKNYKTVSKNGGVYIRVTPGMERGFNARYYYYPVPQGQRDLNPNLSQNPGWK